MSSSLTIGSARIPLIEVFATVVDPRARRGVRHDLAVVLALAAAAVMSGSRSLLSMGEWVLDADREALSRLGIGPGVGLPSESTIRRTLAAVNADDLDRLIGAWMATRVRTVEGRRVIAVDGKSLRGATREGVMPHLPDDGQGQPADAARETEEPALVAGTRTYLPGHRPRPPGDPNRQGRRRPGLG